MGDPGSVIEAEIRRGAYYDSVVLMQLQRSLAALPGVADVGVVMGTGANKEILAAAGLLTPEGRAAGADDLVIVVRARDEGAVRKTLAQIDGLLSRRPSAADQEFRPKSLETAIRMAPAARWVLVSVAGRYAAAVARDALRLGRNVFLYSDHVSLDDEVELKQRAAAAGLLVMGPGCGTAIVNGVGLGFANRVRRGPVGIVAASGTGLQQVTARLHQLGSGITHALGTGGRDLSQAVGAITARQGLDLLSRDPESAVLVLISKPPAREVAGDLLAAARRTGKPVVVDLIGYQSPVRRMDNLVFASTLDETAELAAGLAAQSGRRVTPDSVEVSGFAAGQRFLRGLYSGGTLAYEALLLLGAYLPDVYSNAPLDEAHRLANSMLSRGHTVLDLGEDEFTVGRLHPMMDNDLRLRRLAQEAADPEAAVILLDVVLGFGAHPEPAGELAPAIARARAQAAAAGRRLEVVAVVVGTDQDPQGCETQVGQLLQAGAHVEASHEAAVRHAASVARAVEARPGSAALPPVDLAMLREPMSAINVGLESFAVGLAAQGAAVVQVDWRPPAGGNERLMAILERMKREQ